AGRRSFIEWAVHARRILARRAFNGIVVRQIDFSPSRIVEVGFARARIVADLKFPVLVEQLALPTPGQRSAANERENQSHGDNSNVHGRPFKSGCGTRGEPSPQRAARSSARSKPPKEFWPDAVSYVKV